MYNMISQYKNVPFQWGKNDCALFAADVVNAITGKDYAEEFRGKYFDSESAKDILQKIGKGNLEKTMDSKFRRIKPPYAKRGDVVLYKNALGICTGSESFFYDVSGVIKSMKTMLTEVAWRVE